MATNPDFRDLFVALNDAAADFIVVDAHAVMRYTEPRYTKDLDVWVGASASNAPRILRALQVFGAPLDQVAEADLATPGTIFQIGMAPNRIDIITSVEALDFDPCLARAELTSYGGVPIRVLALDDLIANKRAVGRDQDRLDVQKLERARSK